MSVPGASMCGNNLSSPIVIGRKVVLIYVYSFITITLVLGYTCTMGDVSSSWGAWAWASRFHILSCTYVCSFSNRDGQLGQLCRLGIRFTLKIMSWIFFFCMNIVHIVHASLPEVTSIIICLLSVHWCPFFCLSKRAISDYLYPVFCLNLDAAILKEWCPYSLSWVLHISI